MISTDTTGSSTAADSERASLRRRDRDWLAEKWAGGDALVVRIDSGRIEVAASDSGPQVLWSPTAEVGRVPEDDWVLLAESVNGRALFAVRAPVAAEAGLALRELIVLTGGRDDGGITELVRAVGVLNWHEFHHWCPTCGARTDLEHAGWMRRCVRDGSKHFPRVDPAVIMLVEDVDGRALLGRQSRWATGWFSTLAGFVEPGETFEEAVAREVLEESGVVLARSRYFGSQPWPFPSSVMVGFRAWTENLQPAQPDGKELVEARWFSKETLAENCESGEISLPPRTSISRRLIEDWYGQRLPGRWSRG